MTKSATAAFGAMLGIAACSGDPAGDLRVAQGAGAASSMSGNAGTGAAMSTGGQHGPITSGGALASGGYSTGGQVTGGNGFGGAQSRGGAQSSGGASSNGGAQSRGGAQSSGGVPSTGGAVNRGGSSNGGSPSFGGSMGGKGGVTTGGGKGLGFGGASGGSTAGGSQGTAGRPSGGAATSGGSTGTPSDNCTEAEKTLTSNMTGKHCGYTYEYWKDSGNATLVLKSDGFSVDWSGINDFLGRKGLRPGSGNLVVNYNANFQPNGNAYLCVYGWTTNPLVEYYIVDSWGSWRPPGGEGHVGTLTSDGGTYDIYKIAKSGSNIQGNGSFTQYWSVRTDKKTSGVITVANHFAAWKNNGMPAGTFYEVSMTVEGYQSTGKADLKFSMK